VESARQREQVAQMFSGNPALLRLRELETLRELAQVAKCAYLHRFPEARRSPPERRRGRP